MAAKSLRPGMANVPVNMTEDERLSWARAACERGMSTASLLRLCALEGARQICGEVAAQIAEVRELHRTRVSTARAARVAALNGTRLVMVVGAGCLLLWMSIQPDQQKFARVRPRSRRQEEIQIAA